MSEKDSSKALREAASVMAVGEFWDGNSFCRYSYDIRYPKRRGNTAYWLEHFHKLIHEGAWAGKVKSYAIFRLQNGEKVGDPVVRKSF